MLAAPGLAASRPHHSESRPGRTVEPRRFSPTSSVPRVRHRRRNRAPVRADSPKPATDGPTLEEGDRLFAAGKYLDAGKCYAALARQNRLPPQRNEHWAYCRMVDVARKINLRPRSPREWDEIEAEIVRVQRLSPNIWYGEYLRSKVAEVRKNGRKPLAKSDSLVVRGTAAR